MPGQKRRYNVRFPPSRIKKIMQKDTEVGRIAMAVPVIISRALEMFLKSLLTKTCVIAQSKFSSVVSVAHMRQCIESEKLFHFLKDLVEAATSAAATKDNQGMRTKGTTFLWKNPLKWERRPPGGAAPHLKTPRAPVSRSSLSASERKRLPTCCGISFHHFSSRFSQLLLTFCTPLDPFRLKHGSFFFLR